MIFLCALVMRSQHESSSFIESPRSDATFVCFYSAYFFPSRLLQINHSPWLSADCTTSAIISTNSGDIHVRQILVTKIMGKQKYGDYFPKSSHSVNRTPNRIMVSKSIWGLGHVLVESKFRLFETGVLFWKSNKISLVWVYLRTSMNFDLWQITSIKYFNTHSLHYHICK